MKTMPLGALATVATGGTPDRGQSAYWGGSVPWVGTSEIDFCVITQPSEYLTDAGLAQSAAKLLPKGTLLMAMYGQGSTRGKVAVLGIQAATNQACAAISPKASAVESEYLFHVLEASYEKIRRMSNTGSQENLNTTIIREISIPMPAKAEREAIVKFAQEMGAAIRAAEELIAGLGQRKQGLMQQLLTGQMRLKGFKENWKTYRLNELFAERNETNRSDLPLLSITGGDGVVRHEDTGRKNTSKEDKSAYLRICAGDIGYNTMRMWQGVSALAGIEGIISPAYTVCVPNKLADGSFMAHLFKHRSIVNLFYRYSQGLTSDTWNLKFHHFSEIKVTVPPVSEQTAIASVLGEQDAQLRLANDQLEMLKAQKRALMQKLLSGQWRMPAKAMKGKKS